MIIMPASVTVAVVLLGVITCLSMHSCANWAAMVMLATECCYSPVSHSLLVRNVHVILTSITALGHPTDTKRSFSGALPFVT